MIFSEFIKLLLLIPVQVLANFFVLIFCISISGLPGGEVGMVPFLVFYLSFVPSVAFLIYRLGRYFFKCKAISFYGEILIFNATYILLFFLLGGFNPLNEVNIYIFISTVVAALITSGIYALVKQLGQSLK